MSVTIDSIDVLHVDDNPEFVDLVGTYLKRADDRIDVTPATSADEALRLLDAGDVDCIVSDYDMPETDGLEFLDEVRAAYPDLPFILFTGKGSEEIASEAITAGVTDYLQKKGGIEQYTILENRIKNAVERTRSRRAHVQSERRLSRFIDQCPLGVVEWNTDFEIRRMNPAGEEILGYTEAELEGDSWERLVAESDRETVAEVAETLLASKGTSQTVTECVRSDGETIVCEWNNRVFTDDDGTVDAVFSMFQDVTEREERERDLWKKSNLLEQLFEQVPTNLYVKDTQGRHLWMSDHWFKEDREEMIGKTDLELYTEEIAREAYEDDMQVIESEEPIYNKEEYNPETGEWMLTSKVPYYDEDGDVAGLIGVTQLITERKEYQRELERKNERLEQFASILSHDLRNPLSVAQGRLDIARDECDAEVLDDIASPLDRMAEIVSNMLTLVQEGGRVVEMESVPLSELVDGCWENVATGQATLRVEDTASVKADPGSARHLFENLFRNAVEHGSTSSHPSSDDVHQIPPDSGDAVERGSTTPRPQTHDDAAERGRENVTITVGLLSDGFYVEDDGPGISDDERERIFDVGYSTGKDGTGFGLTIVEQVVEAHGWKIDATEGADGGARFEITGVTFDGDC